MVSDLNQLPGRVKRSDLVQSGRDTSDVVGGLTRAHEQYITVISLWERPENTHLGLIWAHLGLWRPRITQPAASLHIYTINQNAIISRATTLLRPEAHHESTNQ